MSNDPLAKFRGTVATESQDWQEPRAGSIVLRREQLIFVASGEQFIIPLSSIFDVNVGSRPQLFGTFPGVPVTIAYEDANGKRVAALGAEKDYVEKFEPAIYKTILNDTWMSVKHPARRGGRVTDASFQPAILSLAVGSVSFETDGGAISVDTSAVIGFGRQQQTVDGREQLALVIRHIEDGTAVTTAATADSTRTLSLLGRYLRRQYDELLATLSELSLSKAELELLVTIYSTQQSGIAVDDVLDASSKRVSRLLSSLQECSLVQPTASGPALTTKGQVVVNKYSDEGHT